MLKTLVLCTLLGGLVSFVWGALSWMLLPWHHATFKAFRDEDAVSRVLLDNADADAVYGLPAPPQTTSRTTKEETKAIEQAVFEKMNRGPLALVVFQRAGYGSIKGRLVTALLIGMIASFLLTILLLNLAPHHSFLARAALVEIAALAGAVICRLPDWNWHGFSGHYTVVTVADVAIGWFLVGLVLAALSRPH